jgi:hypothetical protein
VKSDCTKTAQKKKRKIFVVKTGEKKMESQFGRRKPEVN